MTIIVLHSKEGTDSAKFLADALNADYENPYQTEKTNYLNYTLVVKYGVSKKIKAPPGKVINKSLETLKAINKTQTFELLAKENVTVPYTKNKEIAKEWINSGWVVARNTENQHNGKGMQYCTTKNEVELSTPIFWTKYVNHTNEFRIYCWKNKVLSIYDKKENDNIFTFHLFKGAENHPQLQEMVNKIQKHIKLDWYGLDVLRDINGTLYLLEINSAPILFPYTRAKLLPHILKEA